MQSVFESTPGIDVSTKNRFFSNDELYKQGRSFYSRLFDANGSHTCCIDSDENYSLGRFKKSVVSRSDPNFNLKQELKIISHDIPRMLRRMKETAPHAKCIGLIRRQADWLESIYSHDVYHFGYDKSFSQFMRGDLGKAYCRSGDYASVYRALARLWGEESIYIELFENLKKDHRAFLDTLSGIVGVPLELPADHSNSRNASLPAATVCWLRHLNKLSQNDCSSRERRWFWRARGALIKLTSRPVVRRLCGRQTIASSRAKRVIMEQFSSGNQILASSIEKTHEMKAHGYFV